MWINLSKDDIVRICSALRLDAQHVPQSAENDLALAERLDAGAKDRLHPSNAEWVRKAFEEYHRDGEVEIDQQADGSALVSLSEDPDDGIVGAYVLAWV